MRKFLIATWIIVIISSCHKKEDQQLIKNQLSMSQPDPIPPGNYWELRQTAPATLSDRSGMANFVVNGKAYMCCGYDHNGSVKKDLWEYDPVTNTFTQKASMPAAASARIYPAAFAINGKGYVGTGGPTVQKDLWEYDPTTNSWTQKADMPGLGRWRAIGFAVGGKGFIGTGTSSYGDLNDFWEYDPIINSWIQKTPIPSPARTEAFVFVVNSKAYVGGGYSPTNKTVYEFQPNAGIDGVWTQKANYPGQGSLGVATFATTSAGYVGTGATINGGFTFYKDFWRYAPTSNTWTNTPDFPGYIRAWAMGFSLNGLGYIGLGRDENERSNTGKIYRYYP
ncbi:MAG: hypothetical protein H7Y31_16705 [Chitinophagaceae bacterium]|nr:hypothetical protein [Chitinophagaceae bacterium]